MNVNLPRSWWTTVGWSGKLLLSVKFFVSPNNAAVLLPSLCYSFFYCTKNIQWFSFHYSPPCTECWHSHINCYYPVKASCVMIPVGFCNLLQALLTNRSASDGKGIAHTVCCVKSSRGHCLTPPSCLPSPHHPMQMFSTICVTLLSPAWMRARSWRCMLL